MATEDLERVAGVCSQGRGKGKHVEVSLSVQEERRRAEDIAAAAVVAAVAPYWEMGSTVLSIIESSFKTAWRGKASCASLALRF